MFRPLLGSVFLVLYFTHGAAGQGRTLTVDDFQDGDRRAAAGLSWVSIADDLAGGASHADLRVAGSGKARALEVSGTVAADGYAGAWVALDGRARAVDLSDFAGIRLRVRGAGALHVALRGGPQSGFNYAAPVDAGRDWSFVDVSLDSLQPLKPGYPPFDRRSVRWLGVTVRGTQPGPFAFAIDDVQLYARNGRAALRVQDGPTLSRAFTAEPPSELPAGPWTELATDAPDDGRQRTLPDATALATRTDGAHGRVWFRIALAGAVPERWVGLNLALDTDGDPANGMEWWGTNKAFHFDRLVSVYGLGSGAGYEGAFGIADAAEVQAGNMIGSRDERIDVVLDRAQSALFVGIPSAALGASGKPVRVVAAVGSAFLHNDDVPNEGAAVLPR
jgi:hypothetical protein